MSMAIDAGDAFETDIRGPTADGIDDEEHRYYHVTGQPKIEAYGKFAGYRGTIRDITEVRATAHHAEVTDKLLHATLGTMSRV